MQPSSAASSSSSSHPWFQQTRGCPVQHPPHWAQQPPLQAAAAGQGGRAAVRTGSTATHVSGANGHWGGGLLGGIAAHCFHGCGWQQAQRAQHESAHCWQAGNTVPGRRVELPPIGAQAERTGSHEAHTCSHQADTHAPQQPPNLLTGHGHRGGGGRKVVVGDAADGAQGHAGSLQTRSVRCQCVDMFGLLHSSTSRPAHSKRQARP